jgi:hypothetical protein
MADVIRRIGLSLGADICWPQCFEDLVARLAPALRIGKDVVRFDVERVTIEPFDLRQPVKYDLVVDRLTHWYHPSREWIKKAVILDGVYVFNNPWAVQAMEKHTTYCAMMRLGMPIPATYLVPPKDYKQTADLRPTLERYAKLFDLRQLGERLGYPLFMKPYDGGGWVGVNKVDNADELVRAYDQSGTSVMHLQQGIVPYEWFVRGIGLGPQVHVVRYDPSVPLHARYMKDVDFISEDDVSLIRDVTLTINAFFGWDFNSCELLGRGGEWYPIDFANPCPDSQVTSLHVHFPWLVKAKIRWALFCAATKRAFRQNLDWEPFWKVAAKDLPYREKLRAYAKIAEQRFEADKFDEFCKKHLASLDEVAWDYFGSDRAKDAVRKKVQALYPPHEQEQFVELFWNGIQLWREREAQKA